MVHGLDKFKAYFKDYTRQYVFIGGTACDILLDELGATFRATKDLDIVLIIEALDTSFAEMFWKFIEDGGYEHRKKGTDKHQYYRFSNPLDESFPKMVELFSKLPNDFTLSFDKGLTPIHIDESIMSLSAIILNSDYYDLLVKSRQTVDDISVLQLEMIILFKIKAWLDMKERKESGEKIDSKNIRKHKNDIFRLLTYVTPSTKIVSSEVIKHDVINFIELVKVDKPDLKNLGISGISFDEILVILENIFLKNSEQR